MDPSTWQEIAFGPMGGAFMFGIFIGGSAAMQFIAPRIYGARIKALEERIKHLEEEVGPYREWKDRMANKALDSVQL